MDIQKIIADLVSKLTGKNDLIAKFTSNPASIIKQLTGLDVNASQLAQIVKGVSDKLGINAADIAKEGTGLLAKIKKLFGGK